MTSQTRKEIEAHFIRLFDKMKADGIKDPFGVIWAMYPDVPELVLILASVESEDNDTEAWWVSMEKTIDGAVIENALAAPPGK